MNAHLLDMIETHCRSARAAFGANDLRSLQIIMRDIESCSLQLIADAQDQINQQCMDAEGHGAFKVGDRYTLPNRAGVLTLISASGPWAVVRDPYGSSRFVWLTDLQPLTVHHEEETA